MIREDDMTIRYVKKEVLNFLEFKSLVPYLPEKRKVIFSSLVALILCLILILFVDRPLADVLRFVNPSFQKFFSHVTLLGRSGSYLVISGTIFILFYPSSKIDRFEKHARPLRKYALIAFFIFVSIAISGLLTDALKVVFARYRPFMLYRMGKYGFVFFTTSPAKVLSFPSGHANTIAALMTALYFVKPRYGLLYLLIALMVMASRVIIGEHFLSDVIVGAYIGFLTTWYLRGFFEFKRINIFVPRNRHIK
jgi:membrane-associated phospholipid phosphatase